MITNISLQYQTGGHLEALRN